MRNYRHEYDSYHGKPKQIKRRTARNAARALMIASGRAKKGDGDANTQIKIFICVNNVTKESGPFCVLDAHHSRIARRRLRYRYHSPNYRVTDDEMEKVLPNYSIFECIGDRGTIFIADPGKCFHYGARTEPEHSRVFAWFNFIPISQQYIPKKKSTISPPFRSLAVSSNLSETQRLVLGSR